MGCNSLFFLLHSINQFRICSCPGSINQFRICSCPGFVPDFFATWNILDEDEKYSDLKNRNNNALENYNHMMNSKFTTPHPYLLVFVQTIKQESQKQVERCARIFIDE